MKKTKGINATISTEIGTRDPKLITRLSEPDTTRWPLIWIGFVAGCAASFNIGKIATALPLLRNDLDLNVVAAGTLVSLFSLISAGCGFFAGFLSSFLGAHRALAFGLCCSFLGSIAGVFASLFAEPYALLVTSRIIEGLGWLLVAVSVPALLAQTSHEKDKSLVLGIWGAFVPVGMLLAFWLSPFLLEPFGWQSLWYSSAILSLLCLFVVRRTFSGVGTPGVAILSMAIIRESVSYVAPWALAGCFLFYSAQFIVVTAFLPTLLLDRYSIALSGAAALVGVVVIANAFGSIASGFLMRRGARMESLLWTSACGMGLAGIVLYLHTQLLWVSMVAAILAVGVGGIIPGTLFAAAPMLSRQARMTTCTVGLMVQAAGVGQLIAPMALGRILHYTGDWTDVAWLCAMQAGMGVGFSLLLSRSKPTLSPVAD